MICQVADLLCGLFSVACELFCILGLDMGRFVLWTALNHPNARKPRALGTPGPAASKVRLFELDFYFPG